MTDQPTKISILHLTDPHILPSPEDRLLGIDTAYYLDAVLRQATRPGHHFDACLVTGDLVQTPGADSYLRLLNILESYDLDYTCLAGNHDDLELMHGVLATTRINCARHIALGNWQLICLNSSLQDDPGGYLAPEELSFLEQRLSENNDLHSLIAIHHHCLPTESLWMDSMIIKNSHDLLELVSRYQNAKLLICGHIHQEFSWEIGNLALFSTPSTCFQFKPYSKEFALDDRLPGYRKIDLFSDGRFRTQVFRLTEPLSGLSASDKGY